MSPDSTFIVEHKGSDTVCLVEDCLSAIKVGRYVTAIALLSSNYREHLSTIIARHDRVIVFLDNDNPTVQREARKIYLRVELLVKDVKLIRATKDPKDHTDEELRDFLL
jgi:DNA primase|tara:strand:+ start:4711 stop:5037 length:327 start_codon:yes stop_codon:yes gene_type:complete